jgi:hypothetical protein
MCRILCSMQFHTNILYKFPVQICLNSLGLSGSVWAICSNMLNSALCPQSAFVCSVLFSQQTEVFVVTNINRLIVVAETLRVSYVVRIKLLYNI